MSGIAGAGGGPPDDVLGEGRGDWKAVAIEALDELARLPGGTGAPAQEPLGRLLCRAGWLDARGLDLALQCQLRRPGARLGRVLVDLRLVDRLHINRALARKFGIPYVRLDRLHVATEHLNRLPPEVAARYSVLPLGECGGRLFVALEDPWDAQALQALRLHLNGPWEPVLAAPRDLALALNRYYSRVDESEALADARYLHAVAEESDPAPAIERQAQSRPIVRLLNALVLQALMREASDINIRPGRDAVAVYYRIDGRPQLARSLNRSLLPALVSRIKIIGGMNVAERRLPQDGHARLVRRGRATDLRISLLPTVFGESVAIRLLASERGLRSVDELGLAAGDAQRLRRMLSRDHGLVLVTGPTGAGKTTTLYALLAELRRRDLHILSVEDPVEYHIEGIEQVQVAAVKGCSFASALRHFLRHDPDAMMVGEIRDEETARVAHRAALTGHLVLSSLHTHDTVGSVARLVDMGVPRYVVASTLAGVVAQRLVRELCRRCRRPADMPSGDEGIPYRPGGCGHCRGTGYRGRAVAAELLEVTPALAGMIAAGDDDALRAAAREAGMRPLREAALALAHSGRTSMEELITAGLL